MTWKDLITNEIEFSYNCTFKLFDMVSDEDLTWKPSQGGSWMTTGQLLMHITQSCGICFHGFVTNDWGLPEDFDYSKLTKEEIEAMNPTAEMMPTVNSVAEAREGLEEDKQLALNALAFVSEDDLETKFAQTPWDQSEEKLGRRLLEMTKHLIHHSEQLFCYLKLQGKPVNTIQL